MGNEGTKGGAGLVGWAEGGGCGSGPFGAGVRRGCRLLPLLPVSSRLPARFRLWFAAASPSPRAARATSGPRLALAAPRFPPSRPARARLCASLSASRVLWASPRECGSYGRSRAAPTAAADGATQPPIMCRITRCIKVKPSAAADLSVIAADLDALPFVRKTAQNRQKSAASRYNCTCICLISGI